MSIACVKILFGWVGGVYGSTSVTGADTGAKDSIGLISQATAHCPLRICLVSLGRSFGTSINASAHASAPLTAVRSDAGGVCLSSFNALHAFLQALIILSRNPINYITI
jgi:hypothetical protein